MLRTEVGGVLPCGNPDLWSRVDCLELLRARKHTAVANRVLMRGGVPVLRFPGAIFLLPNQRRDVLDITPVATTATISRPQMKVMQLHSTRRVLRRLPVDCAI